MHLNQNCQHTWKKVILWREMFEFLSQFLNFSDYIKSGIISVIIVFISPTQMIKGKVYFTLSNFCVFKNLLHYNICE